MGLTPYFNYTTDWFFLYETSQAFLAQVLYYASGIELPAFSVRQDNGQFAVTSPEKTVAEGRIRQPDNSVIRNSLDFTNLPAGRYAADVLVRRDGALVNFGAFPFTVEEVVAMGRAPHRKRSWAARDAAVVADALTAQGLGGQVITPAKLRHLYEMLLDIGHVDRLRMPGLKEDRRQIGRAHV